VTVGDESVFLFTEDELATVKQRHLDEQKRAFDETLASIPREEITEHMREFHPKGLAFVEFYDDTILRSLKDKLEQTHCVLECYQVPSDKPIYTVADDKEQRTEIFKLKDLIELLRANGRNGVEIQRYKGLGEMNPEQLWETTMDPSKRSLLKVSLSDAVAAEHMFTMLMGEEVPPRRAFIEQHALSVKNLDI
jgi:DNA gyrase subunit B